MCGRFTIMLDASEAKEAFDLESVPADWRPRWNVAPSQPVAVVTNLEERKAQWMKWGLVPSWAKDASIGSRMINARSETVMEKPSFRAAFTRRRCLILADGFYEWQRVEGKSASPFLFQRKDKKPFAFAGLWETWKNPEGEELRTTTILTTSANDVVAPVHERMPVMLTLERGREWLREKDPMMLIAFLTRFPADDLTRVGVSRMVNDPVNDSPALLLPL